MFPIEGKRFRLDLDEIHAQRKEFSHKDEKKAILTSSSLTYPIKGTLRLTDKASGRVLDRQEVSLADTFYITGKHTMVYSGNNYIASNLLVRLPGVFVRTRNDGQLEAEFNTGVGRSFSITLNPQTQIFYIETDSSQIPIAVLLRDVLNTSEESIRKHIPAEVWEANKQAVTGKQERYITQLYSRFVSKTKQNKADSLEKKLEMLRESITKGQLSKITTEITLGTQKETMDSETFLLAMQNLIAVYRGDRDEDNRDSLQFKRVQNLPDFIRNRFTKNNETVTKAKMKMAFNLDRYQGPAPKIKEVVPVKPFNKVFTDFIVNSTLSNTPSETNPIESLESVGKVTLIGPNEGGASEERQIPLDARNIHASQLGIIDPSRTPESSTAGIDQRFTIAARRDDEGIMYTEVADRNGVRKHISVQEMMKSVIGFPGQEKKGPNDIVHAQVRGKVQEIEKKKVDYWILDSTHMYTITTNLVPFLNSNHPGRLTMAGKAVTQALSLKEREKPLVQTVDEHGVPFVKRLGAVITRKSPVDGVVTKVSHDSIEIKDSSGERHKVDLVKNLPFNMKGFVDDEAPLVKEGDKVKKGQLLADNNYTRDGQLTLGKNLYAAYMPYKGYNHEDGIVISRSAANGLSSLHAYKYDYTTKADTVKSKAQFQRRFSGELTPEQLNLLDDDGVVKKGARLKHGDPVYAFLEKRTASDIDKALGRLDKILVKPFNKVLERWEHDEVGEVVDVHSESADIRIIVRSIKPLEIGDKLTGLHGNKGIVSLILEDHEMPTSKETGKPADLLLNPASVTSRINLGQIVETAAAKVAQKTGKTYLVKNFENENNLTTIRKQMKDAGVKDTDMMYDPKTGKEFGEVLAGPQYFLKLFKTTDSNYAARNVGSYDAYLQPAKGGEAGAKGVGYMEFLGLLGSDARKNLREISTIKSEKNEEFWDKFMLGQPLPKPKQTFATKKFFSYLKAAGINVRDEDGHLITTPMTDSDTLRMSNGRIHNAEVISAKNGQPERGGLFDIAVTGGIRGEKWGHYKLSEPVVNPVFEKPVKTMLGLRTQEFEGIANGSMGVQHLGSGVYSIRDHDGKELNRVSVKPGVDAKMFGGFKKKAAEEELLVGGHAFQHMLAQISPTKDLTARVAEYKSSKSAQKRDKLVKQIKYLKGLNDMGISDPASAYTMQHMAILPPNMRPVLDKGGNKMDYADINALYKEMILSDQGLHKLRDDLPDFELTKERKAVYDSVKAVTGMGEALGPRSKKQGLKGIMTQLTGVEGPKGGMFHSRLLKRNQDMSGRGTIYAAPDVGFNEAKFPKEMLWTMFRMHMTRELVRNGMTLIEAKQAWEKRTPAAENVFQRLCKTTPVILNRPPTLMKTNVMAMYPIPVEGKTIGMNILHLPGFAADFDGDALTVHTPMTPEAIQEAKDKLLPMRNLSDARLGPGNPMFSPAHEAILGSVHLTNMDTTLGVMKFKTEADALAALNRGEIHDNQPIEITG